MSDTAGLKPYKPQDLPKLEGSIERYIVLEHRRISQTTSEIIAALQRLEARMVVAGI